MDPESIWKAADAVAAAVENHGRNGMRKLHLGMIVLALALVPAALSAQETGRPTGQGMGRGMGGGMGMGNPASLVLRHQAELGLTPDQLEKLGKIRDKFDHENGEALKAMAKERDEMVKKYGPGPYTDEQQEKMRAERAEHRGQYQKLGENSRNAREDIRKLLTPEQFTKLQQYMQMGRRPGGAAGDQDRR
jgi:Spy/CpxP family protein refolding chaperone